MSQTGIGAPQSQCDHGEEVCGVHEGKVPGGPEQAVEIRIYAPCAHNLSHIDSRPQISISLDVVPIISSEKGAHRHILLVEKNVRKGN